MISEWLVSLFFLVVSTVFLLATLDMPIGHTYNPGPGFLPLLLALFMVSISGGLLFRQIFQPVRGSIKLIEKGTVSRSIFLVGWLIAYWALLPLVGFFVLTFVFEAVFLKVLGVSRGRTILVVAFGAACLSILIFEIWCQIPFPKGLWWPR